MEGQDQAQGGSEEFVSADSHASTQYHDLPNRRDREFRDTQYIFDINQGGLSSVPPTPHVSVLGGFERDGYEAHVRRLQETQTGLPPQYFMPSIHDSNPGYLPSVAEDSLLDRSGATGDLRPAPQLPGKPDQSKYGRLN